MNFSGDLQNVTLSMQPGESITLSLSIEHAASAPKRGSNGVDLNKTAAASSLKVCSMSPKLILVDASRLAHVELEHRLHGA